MVLLSPPLLLGGDCCSLVSGALGGAAVAFFLNELKLNLNFQ